MPRGAITVDVALEERYWHPEDGGEVWLAGFQVVEDAAEPGRRLVLRRDPGNPHDPATIAVHADDGQQLGWVPRELAAQLASELDAGRAWSAVVLREQRPTPRDPRSGLTMLLARAAAVQLSPHAGRR